MCDPDKKNSDDSRKDKANEVESYLGCSIYGFI